MASVREVLAAKIAAGEADLASLKNDLAAEEAKARTWLDQEVEGIKEFFANIGKHL
jgi:hypothetical protein